MDAHPRIIYDYNVLGGRACIRGTRTSVSELLNLMADGMSPAEIIAKYPDLTEDKLAAALR